MTTTTVRKWEQTPPLDHYGRGYCRTVTATELVPGSRWSLELKTPGYDTGVKFDISREEVATLLAVLAAALATVPKTE